jgi:hypothetical protein
MVEIRTAAEQLAAEQQQRAASAEQAEDLVQQLEDVLRHHGLEVGNGDRANGGVPGRRVTKGAVSE